MTFEYKTKYTFIYTSVYLNHFNNYIYLAPTAEKFYGFDVFRYKQQDATIRGLEVVLQYQIPALKNITIKSVYNNTFGILADKRYLPFIPANKSTSSVKWDQKAGKNKKYIEVEYIYCFKQDRPSTFELPTADYQLVNLYSGIQTLFKGKETSISLNCTNLFNVTYVDHLSRLKYYGLYNMGRNISLSLKIKI
ncbi:MAG: TonB-dependent receptor [Bacteroidetes bacterium]|nr:TonB-dependent receptor [Bacteroidota bacterium]